MNRTRLQQVFSNYINKFEYINNKTNNESYKWQVAYKFHDLIDPDHPDFKTRIKEAWNLSENLIDSSNRYCFSALVKCANTDTDAVRELFRALFADDGGDLVARQRKILQFIEDANALTQRLVSTNGMFMNDQRSAMGYLFLNDPDNYYLYKASEANDFASCVEFYDDWGSGAAFNLENYYRMCDMMVKEIHACEPLKETNKGRFFDKEGNPIEGMHPDTNYHILAFDIIYGAPAFRYNFYDGIPFSTITAQTRKLHQDRVEKALERQKKLIAAQEKADKLAEARKYFMTTVTPGLKVRHKTFGNGEVVSIDHEYVTVTFPDKAQTKPFMTMMSFAGGFLAADVADMAEKIALYKDVIYSERSVVNALKQAETEFAEYKEYLE